MPFHVTEPHPSVPRSAYIHAGRGGAGNYARYNTADLTAGPVASGPASAALLTTAPKSNKYMSGRGGAGNTFKRSESQRAIFSFDEELERERRMMDNASKTPVYHVGRGGAGNAVDELRPSRGSLGRGGSVSSDDSAASDASARAKRGFSDAFGRISRTFSRNA